MAELQLTRNLLLIFFFVIRHTMQESTGKSVTMNFDLVPEWKAEISQRASDYGNLLNFCFDGKIARFSNSNCPIFGTMCRRLSSSRDSEYVK